MWDISAVLSPMLTSNPRKEQVVAPSRNLLMRRNENLPASRERFGESDQWCRPAFFQLGTDECGAFDVSTIRPIADPVHKRLW